MLGAGRPSYLLPDSELAEARGHIRRGPEDMADLVRAMLADAVFNDRDAKDPIELSRLAGLSLARVSSALAAGESRGLFQRGPSPTRTATGLSKTVWRLSPDLTDLAAKFADFAQVSSRCSVEVPQAVAMHPPKDVPRNSEVHLSIGKTGCVKMT